MPISVLHTSIFALSNYSVIYSIAAAADTGEYFAYLVLALPF